jgi:hypothetical protein
MSDRSLGYVVVTFNQASCQPELNLGADLTDMETAIRQRDMEQAETAKAGRHERHVVAEVFELTETEIAEGLEAERAKWRRMAERAAQRG